MIHTVWQGLIAPVISPLAILELNRGIHLRLFSSMNHYALGFYSHSIFIKDFSILTEQRDVLKRSFLSKRCINPEKHELVSFFVIFTRINSHFTAINYQTRERVLVVNWEWLDSKFIPMDSKKFEFWNFDPTGHVTSFFGLRPHFWWRIQW